jgi:hypothetical protein
MGKASLLLLIGLASLAYVQGCTFKENAKELISVGYFTDTDGNTAVDRIEVQMKEKEKFENLMDGCTRPRAKKIKVQYRVKGTAVWNEGGKKTLTSTRPISLTNLNPCETYEVQVTVVNTPLGVFPVGPFYDGEHGHVYLHEEQGNENYEAYSQNPSDHIKITSEESSAKILVSGFCARTVVLEVQAEGEGEKAKQLLLQNDLKNPQNHTSILPDLKPCTKYQVILDLYLNKKATLEAAADDSNEDYEDYIDPNFATFYTMPSMDGLEKLASFDTQTKTLSWDFNKFFDQDCADSEPTNIKVTLTEGKVMEVMDLAGSKKMIADCGRDLSLQVAYDKQENKWRRNVTVFNEFVSGDRAATEESVKVDNEHLVLTVDPCNEDPDMVEFSPLKAADHVSPIQLTLEELRSSKLESEMGWMGCLDYEVRIHRSGQEVKKLNQLKHPGWKRALDGVTLHVLLATNDSVEMRKPEIFWEDRAIKMKVVCNGSLTEGEFVTVDQVFEVDEALELTGLLSSTEYECAARLFKDDGSSSGWSDEWSVSTLETGQTPPPQTSPPEVVTRSGRSSDTEEVPDSSGQQQQQQTAADSSGNLNFASFLSLTALVSTSLLLARSF